MCYKSLVFSPPKGRSKRRETRLPTERPLIRSSRYSEAEWQAITEAAARAGKLPSTFIREAALGQKITARRGAANDAAVKELNRIGNNLNQVARAANAGGMPDLERSVRESLAELVEVIRRL